MSRAAETLSMSYAEYVAAESASECKHEWLGGEYVLLSQRERRIEVHRLNASGHWELHEAVGGESIELTSLGCRLTVDEVYRDPLAS